MSIKISACTIAKNEALNIGKSIESYKEYVDEIIIVDTGSIDETVEIAEKLGAKVLKFEWKNDFSAAKNYAIDNATGDWILFLDADEIFENRIVKDIKHMLKNNEVDAYCFRLYDMWKPLYYRDDEYWYAHKHHRPFLIRYQPNFKYKFLKQNHHCGRMPKNVLRLNYINSDIRLKHLGWLDDEDKKNKYDRYKKLDKDGIYGNNAQYESILDKNPNLVEFKEEE